jgi:hypothetical protein
MRLLEAGEFDDGLAAVEAARRLLGTSLGVQQWLQGFMLRGRWNDARQSGERELEEAQRRGDQVQVNTTATWLAEHAIWSGKMAEYNRLVDQYADSGAAGWGRVRSLHALLTGEIPSVPHLLPRPEDGGGVPYTVAVIHGWRALMFAHLGKQEVAAGEYRLMSEALAAGGRRGLSAGQDVTGADLGLFAGMQVFADGFASQLANEAERIGLTAIVSEPRGFFLGRFWQARSMQRQLADCANGLDLLDEAERLYLSALDDCVREEVRIEEGRCHLGLASLAERRGDIKTAREHLDAAGELFAKYGVKFFLDQVIAKKEILRA